MSDFQLSINNRGRQGLNLGNFRLQLDPAIEAEMQALESMIRDGRFRRICLTPNWSMFQESDLDRMLRRPLPAPSAPLVPRGAGPAVPRPGTRRDLMEAFWRLPDVQSAANRVLDDVGNTFLRRWRSASTGEQVMAVSHTLVMGAGALAAIYRDPEARQILSLIQNTDIPVPGADGMSFRLAPRGGGLGFDPPAVPGLGARAGFTVNDASSSRPVDVSVMVTFDVAQWLRSR